MNKMESNDQRSRITKMMIRNSFLSLLREKPMQRITVRELCEKAQINRSTFYSYYLDVYDLLQNIEHELLDAFAQSLLIEINNWTDISAIGICKKIFKVLEKNSALCEVLLGANGDYVAVEKCIEIGKNFFMAPYIERYPQIDPSLLENYYIFVSSGAISLLRNWLYSDTEISSDEMAQQIGTMIDSTLSYLETTYHTGSQK